MIPSAHNLAILARGTYNPEAEDEFDPEDRMVDDHQQLLERRVAEQEWRDDANSGQVPR